MNKTILNILSLVCLVLLFSCKGTKTITDSNVIKPKNDKVEDTVRKGKGKVDTIYWTQIDRQAEYEKTIEDLDLDKRASYNVSLLYPFGLERNDESDIYNPKTKVGKVIQYYAGTTLALRKLEEENIDINVTVLDSESGSFDSKIQKSRNADVIIGPRERGQLSTTAQYGLNNEVPIVSPWLSSSKITKDNPYYIQLKPSLKDHMVKIVEDISLQYPVDQVFLLGRNAKKDRAMMRYIQEVAGAYYTDKSNNTFQEYYIEEDSLRIGDTAFDSLFFEDKETIFILPNWSFSEDEEFVYNTVRKMSGEKGLNQVVLYGMPILLESDKVKFEHYSGLNMRICRSSYVDKSLPEIKEFREAYYKEYNTFPSEDAYQGYDMMVFIGRSLFNYGKKFQYFLDTYESALLHTAYDIQKVFDGKDDAYQKMQYLQNKNIYILKFENNRFTVQK